MKAIITNSYYTLKPFKVHWIGRWENGEKMRYSFNAPFRPYFYYEDENGNIIRKETDIPSEVAKERTEYLKTYEADLVYPERVLIDLNVHKGVEIFDPNNHDITNNYKPTSYKGIPVRKKYIDIETDDRVKIDLENPGGEVLSIAMRDSFKNLTVLFTTIPKERINTEKLMNLLITENTKIRMALKEKHLERLLPYVKNMDLQVISKKNEKEMLQAYRNHLYSDKYGEVNIGYNINGFDLPYLQNRGQQQYGINMGYRYNQFRNETNVTHNLVTNFDLYRAYMRLQENDMDSFSLESVSQRELGIGKIKHTEGYREMYDKEPEKFIVYNYRDALLCQLLDLKLGIYDFFLMLSDKAGTLDSGRWNATYLIDTLLFRKHDPEFRIPTHSEKHHIDTEGGKVLDASTGIFRNVVVFDFKHMYPNLFIQYNISHDTILYDDKITKNDIYIGEIGGRKVGFRKDKIGIIPRSIKELVKERYEIKARAKKYPPDSDEYQSLWNEQRTVKEIDNAFFGINGSEYARLFNEFIEACILFLGREQIMFVANFITSGILETIRRKGWKVIYGDTDSVFVWHPDWDNMETSEVISEATQVSKLINDHLTELVEKHNGDTTEIFLEMEFEKIYSAWEQYGSQKQYAGWIVWKDGKYLEKPEFDIKGFDPRRSDKSIYATDYFLIKFLKLALEDREKALEFYESESEKWENHDIDPETIGIYISLNKDSYVDKNGRERSYMPKRAYDHAIREGINLDRMKGKFRMYFLNENQPNDVIAINYDDKLPSKYLKKLDWNKHRERCLDVKLVKSMMKELRIDTENYEVDE